MKKTIAILSLLVFVGSTFAQKQLKDFESVMEAMKTGKTVKAVFYYGKCQLISDNEIEDKSPDAIGGMKLETWEYFAPMSVYNKKAFVVASESKLIENPIGGGFVYNYVKVKISDDNKVRVIARYLDATTKEVIMDESFYSVINNGSEGEDAGAMYFYIGN